MLVEASLLVDSVVLVTSDAAEVGSAVTEVSEGVSTLVLVEVSVLVASVDADVSVALSAVVLGEASVVDDPEGQD